MWEKVRNFGSNVLLGLFLLMLVGVALITMGYTNSLSTKKREKVYVQGQYDALNGRVELARIGSENFDAYAQGHDDVLINNKIIIKSVTDSTFVFTASPWKKGGSVPSDTIKVML